MPLRVQILLSVAAALVLLGSPGAAHAECCQVTCNDEDETQANIESDSCADCSDFGFDFCATFGVKKTVCTCDGYPLPLPALSSPLAAFLLPCLLALTGGALALRHRLLRRS